MIGKKDAECFSFSWGYTKRPHMVYECEVFQSIIENQDLQTYERLCDHTCEVVSLLETSIQQRDEM